MSFFDDIGTIFNQIGNSLSGEVTLSGKVYDTNGETIPRVNVYISDSKGKIGKEKKNVSADIDGNYSITALPAEYVTANYIGQKQTVKAADVCKGGTCSYNFTVQPLEVTEMVVIGKKKEEKKNWKKIALISALALIGIIAIGYGIKKANK
jgi:hypothetical protein|tara:strand:+ start:17760 stop:18212 length:453 start_codon:yes stop_codon:yes gene_type:complete